MHILHNKKVMSYFTYSQLLHFICPSFSTSKSPQFGQSSPVGISHVAVLHLGKLLQP